MILGRHVAGVVSEADLLSVLDQRARHAQLEPGGRLHRHAGDKKHRGLTAGELMTSPAITIHPDATLPAAARLMNSRHLKRLPVVDSGGGGLGGNLVGIVSRCDLLSVFLRPDEDIAREVREMLAQILLADPASVTARVQNGVVTLAGYLGSCTASELIVWRLTWVHTVGYAARWYSLITPPRTLRRWTGSSSDGLARSSWSGGRCWRDWCGRCPL